MTQVTTSDDPGCCGTLGSLLVKIFVIGGLVLGFIAMICIFVGGTGVFGMQVDDYLAMQVYYACMCGVGVIVTSVLAFIYYWTRKPSTFWWTYAIGISTITMIFLCIYAFFTPVTQASPWNFNTCSSLTAVEYTEIVAVSGGQFVCVSGRDNSDLGVAFTPDDDLKIFTGWAGDLATLYAGLSLGLFAILFFMGVFACLPPKKGE